MSCLLQLAVLFGFNAVYFGFLAILLFGIGCLFCCVLLLCWVVLVVGLVVDFTTCTCVDWCGCFGCFICLYPVCLLCGQHVSCFAVGRGLIYGCNIIDVCLFSLFCLIY